MIYAGLALLGGLGRRCNGQISERRFVDTGFPHTQTGMETGDSAGSIPSFTSRFPVVIVTVSRVGGFADASNDKSHPEDR